MSWGVADIPHLSGKVAVVAERPGMPVRHVTESGGSVVSASVVIADEVVD